jgi:hypothetical protein
MFENVHQYDVIERAAVDGQVVKKRLNVDLGKVPRRISDTSVYRDVFLLCEHRLVLALSSPGVEN